MQELPSFFLLPVSALQQRIADGQHRETTAEEGYTSHEQPNKTLPTYKDRICLIYRVDYQRNKGSKTIVETIRKAII